jgi:hypothetical protein
MMEVVMECDCNGSAFACSAVERQSCLQAGCREGASFTSLWATADDAGECAKRLTRESGDLHFVETSWQFAGDAPVGVDTYLLVNNNEMKCEPGRVYDACFGSNRLRAERCAVMLNEWMTHRNLPARFQAVWSGGRILFSDVWQVDEV